MERVLIVKRSKHINYPLAETLFLGGSAFFMLSLKNLLDCDRYSLEGFSVIQLVEKGATLLLLVFLFFMPL